MYSKPTVTTIGDFKDVTNGARKAREKDLLEVDGRPVGETMDLTSFHISLAVGANDD